MCVQVRYDEGARTDEARRVSVILPNLRFQLNDSHLDAILEPTTSP